MTAVISSCGKFRYRLERDVQLDGKLLAFFGINPSTADARENDATVRKWIGFTKVNGGRGFIVGNVSPVRSPDVKVMQAILVPPDVWRSNMRHITAIAQQADILVPCWGDRAKAPKFLQNDFDTVLAILASTAKPVVCFGKTLSGDPKHPLRLPYNTPLVPMNADS